jgi:hypothetical protein
MKIGLGAVFLCVLASVAVQALIWWFFHGATDGEGEE